MRAFRHLKALVLLNLMLLCFGVTASAEGGRITFSDPSCTVEEDVTVTVSVSNVSGYDVTLKYDSDYLIYKSCSGDAFAASSGADTLHIATTAGTYEKTTFRFSLTFTSKAAGKTSISVEALELYDEDGNDMTADHVGNSAVTINAKPAASSEARLSSLSLKPGTLEPAFSPDVYNYTLTVPYETSSLTLAYQTKDSTASSYYNVYLNELKVGTTNFFIVVTAQDKTEKKYSVTITRQESTTTAAAQTQAEKTTAEETGSAETTAAETTAESTAESTEAVTVSIISQALTVTLVPMPEIMTVPEGYTRDVRTAEDGTAYEVLVQENTASPDHVLVYGKKAESEEPELYVLDLQDGTLQRLSLRGLAATEETETSSEEASAEITSGAAAAEDTARAESRTDGETLIGRLTDKLKTLPRLVWMAAAGLLGLIVIIVLLVILRNKKRREEEDWEPAERQEKQAVLPTDEDEFTEWKDEPEPGEWQDEPEPGEWTRETEELLFRTSEGPKEEPALEEEELSFRLPAEEESEKRIHTPREGRPVFDEDTVPQDNDAAGDEGL